MKDHEICKYCKNDTWHNGIWFKVCDMTWAWCYECGALFNGEKWMPSKKSVL